MRGLFITGTDTGVGKTVITAALLATLRAQGVDALAVKPVLTGTDEVPAPLWPADHMLLASLAGVDVATVNFAAYGPAVSPHLAAALSGSPIEPAGLVEAIRGAGSGREIVLVEGVGGLLVPLGDGFDVRMLAAELDLALVVVARAGLGTINHTLLTLEAARSAGLEVAGVVLNRWPRAPGAIERSNRETIERLGAVETCTFPELPGPAPGALAAAGATLPARRWAGASDRAAGRSR